MTNLHESPELRAYYRPQHTVRIPPEMDVPVTSRMLAVIDTAPFRRLSHISQLGLVSTVYPGATHTRLEHSLGAYRMALQFLARLAQDEMFSSIVSEVHIESFLLAALLHDIGHWPYCHPIEDLRLPNLPRHEPLARGLITTGAIAECIQRDWQVSPAKVADLLAGMIDSPADAMISSLLSGPIDIDKMDYLVRDSLHSGVPYGRNFDQQRLISSLCIGSSGKSLAIEEKGRTAAEMMVFARYVMFSEVYWHHAVRSATAMLQRAAQLIGDENEYQHWFGSSEPEFQSRMLKRSAGTPAEKLVGGIFGPVRKLYKRVAQFHYLEQPEMHAALSRRGSVWLARCSRHLADRLSVACGKAIEPSQVLIDAPPVKLEVQFNVEVRSKSANAYHALGEVSPVVKTLATKQFDDYVKRVRIFVDPDLINDLPEHDRIIENVKYAIQDTESDTAANTEAATQAPLTT